MTKREELPEPAAPTPAFDAFHPPHQDLINDCVHCGFCLPTCPTYALWGEEMDSPRGRIYLMQEGLDGEPLTPSMVGHFDACLGCMACVTSCPSGVQYDKLITQTRAQVERRHTRSRAEKLWRGLIFALFPYPRRLKALRPLLTAYQKLGLGTVLRKSGLARLLPPKLRAMESLAPPMQRVPQLPTRVRARGQRRAVVGLVTGCVQDAFFAQVNAATARVLASEGCDVVIPPNQPCCGALSEHSGRGEEAAGFARKLIRSFAAFAEQSNGHSAEQSDDDSLDYIVINSAGCGSTLKSYPELLQDPSPRDNPAQARQAREFSARVRDIAELLVELGPRAQRHPLPVTVAYHDACHLSHGQGIRAQPRQLLREIPELQVREIAESELCCGSAGIYNLLQPEPAQELGQRKARNVLATGAELLVSANPGCAMQLRVALEREGRQLGLAHLVQVLDASLHQRTLSQFGIQ